MADRIVTVAIPMAKTTNINIRISAKVKAAIDQAAKKRGRTVTNYLIWLAAQDDTTVKEAVLEAALND